MKYKHLLLLFIVSSFIASCGSNSRKFTIVGKISNMPVQTVILEQVNANDIITIVDSERSEKNGRFEISGISPEPGLYRLHFSTNRYILLSIDKGNITVNSDWNTIENYTVSGSPGSESLEKFIITVRERLRDVNTIGVVIDTLQAKGKDSLLAVAKKDRQEIELHFTEFIELYADTTHFEPNAIFAVRMLNAMTEVNYLDAFSQSLGRKYAGTRMTHDFDEYFKKISKRIHQPRVNQVRVDVGVVAPEITMNDPDGKPRSLSALKGKYVLIDFWASWSKTCRADNPLKVAAYKKYKDRNFTIFSVSLDNRKEEWKKAIEEDKLSWTNVSDLKGMSSDAARLYTVSGIPFNFLIDPSGKVVARDLRGEQIEAIISKIVP